MPSAPTIAALDLGSNTFRLMLAEKEGGAWAGKRVFQDIPRLSEGLTEGGLLQPQALARAWAALEFFAAEARSAGAVRVLAGATMVARLAADSSALLAEISRRYGWETVILSGREEAGLTATGVLTVLAQLPARGLIFDIGGRSTEFILVEGARILRSWSLNIGVVGLVEAYLSASAGPDQFEAARRVVRVVLAGVDFSLVPVGVTLLGTAGTVTTVATLLLDLKEYSSELINEARLTRSAVEGLLSTLAPLTVAERVSRYNLHPRRADAIVAGLLLLLEVLNFFHQDEFLVSDNGLLEGLWLKAAGFSYQK
ncbi:MAG: hypothetical protein AMR96_06365 [Candidatus Adiutrix intracellularis]|nr:MAG: hypothetical protein AMR96_06365 [Candidatus Adiutrix intracellularis]